MKEESEAPAAGSALPGFPSEKARIACQERQTDCPHEWALSTQRNGLLLWRFHQDDCPRCLKMWMEYWKSRAKAAEGVKTIVRRCRCPHACGVHGEIASNASAPSGAPESVSERGGASLKGK